MTRRIPVVGFAAFAALVIFSGAPSVHAQCARLHSLEQWSLAQERRTLEAQLADAHLKYTDTHPVVVSLQKRLAQISRLIPAGMTGRAERRARALKRRELKTQLADAHLRYTDTHPVVRTLQAQLDALNNAR